MTTDDTRTLSLQFKLQDEMEQFVEEIQRQLAVANQAQEGGQDNAGAAAV